MSHNNSNQQYNRKRLGWKKSEMNKPTRKYNKVTAEEAEILKRNGVSKNRFYNRLNKGWTREKALNFPLRTYHKITKEERRLMKESGVDEATFRTRVSRNMDRKKAATMPKQKKNDDLI
ncbi:hypothetical protein FAF40_01500 [Staphylococcus haemolyticus]|uniref:hypothetical protein n=1 Tax=Staphylococcus haemolyticus TaxID=1283 RepID=UPI0010AD32AC|nr:hypothetical protein [Staphylococcus haemolyticus]TJX74022.1 hypothetical protein FAF40_01500 [Staphylococcus haemolyticus]HCV2365122.1 hypothetical protein [Staphylococcus aureus]HDF1966539.1 hypothetical protein [Staphylococcus aureus]HDJ5786359.1 hypothetical protein [Staphylococcus aureus]